MGDLGEAERIEQELRRHLEDVRRESNSPKHFARFSGLWTGSKEAFPVLVEVERHRRPRKWWFLYRDDRGNQEQDTPVPELRDALGMVRVRIKGLEGQRAAAGRI